MYFLGVESGGTKTTAILVDAQKGIPVRSMVFPPGNIAVIGKEKTSELIDEILSALDVKSKLHKIAWSTFALAGAGREEENRNAREIIKANGIERFSLMTDAEILNYAIFADEPGILLASGTGSICVFKDSENKYRRKGGWGYLLGDEGSGFDIGKKAIQAAIAEAESGKQSSELTRNLFRFYKIDKPAELITLVYATENPQNKIASCAKLVSELAEAAEPNAVAIIDSAVDALLLLADKAIVESGFPAPYKIALAGSALTESSIVNKKFREQARRKGIPFEYLQQEIHAAAAAVLFSIRTSGQAVHNELKDRLKQVTFEGRG